MYNIKRQKNVKYEKYSENFNQRNVKTEVAKSKLTNIYPVLFKNP